jgi:protein involved in polysaccharide export with SLBB domain
VELPDRRRLATWSVFTVGFYLSAALWCTAPAAAQEGGRGADDAASAAPKSARDPQMPNAPPDAGGTLQEEVLDPARYIVGPGDLLALTFWGVQNFNHRLRVDPQGRLFVPNVGYIAVAGQSLAAVDKAVGARVRAAYPRLKYGLMLLQPRRFVIHVAGLVKNPEAYAVTALTRVSAVLTLAGGRAPGGSIRNIQVRRAGAVILADLVPFLQLGDRSQNPFVLEGDVIYVPPARLEVAIDGAVYRPGAYELRAGTLEELLALAGGAAEYASTTLPIRVLNRRGGDRVANVRLGALGSAGLGATVLRHGDRVMVPSSVEGVPQVIVQGAVGSAHGVPQASQDKRLDTAGSAMREVTLALPFYEGDTVRMILERAGGLLPWADARSASVERRDGKGKVTRFPVDAHALLILRDITNDLPLRAGDIVYVPAERESIMVSGPVYRPGLYQYNPRYTAADYVNLAGGPTPNGTTSGAQVIAKNGSRTPLDKAAVVAPGDTVSVKPKALTTFEWVQILLTASTLLLSAVTITITLRK